MNYANDLNWVFQVCTSVRDTSQKYMQKAEDLQEPEYVRRGEFKKLYFNMLPTK